MMSPDNIAVLVKALGNGSVEAFDKLYLLFRPKVERVVGSIVGGGNYQIVNDIVQNIFLNVWRKRSLIADTVRDFDAYLFRMTKNETLNFLSRYSMPFEDLQENVPFYAEDVQQSVETMEIRKRVMEAVKMLPPQQRRVFELSRISQLSYKEIAEELDISPKTVENHLSRALKDLKKSLS